LVRSKFFLLANALLFAIVLVGFSRTLYLRAFFDVAPIPLSLYFHGAALTLWFLLALIQPLLVSTGRTSLHRAMGYGTAGYAAVAVISGLTTNARMASHIKSPDDAENIIVWGNYLSLLAFAGLVGAAVVLRRRPEAHKRLMLLASVSIVGPALGRFPLWPIFAAGLDAARNYALGGLLVLLSLMLGYDLWSRGRPHPATWMGALAIFVSIGAAVAIGLSTTGLDLLHSMFARV
jgi:hypothetical protein